MNYKYHDHQQNEVEIYQQNIIYISGTEHVQFMRDIMVPNEDMYSWGAEKVLNEWFLVNLVNWTSTTA